jgi:hypothetical protein
MWACVILQNMIIEDKWDLNLELFCDNVGSLVKPSRNPNKIKSNSLQLLMLKLVRINSHAWYIIRS